METKTETTTTMSLPDQDSMVDFLSDCNVSVTLRSHGGGLGNEDDTADAAPYIYIYALEYIYPINNL